MPRLRIIVAIAGFALGNPLFAQSVEPQTALALLDSYLAERAPSEPTYRTDLRAGGEPNQVPPGRFWAVGPMIGPFTYRAKAYGELTKEERRGVLRDPRFRAFLVATRAQEDHPWPRKPEIRGLRGASVHFHVDPEEMLQDRPVLVVVGCP